MVEQRDGIGDVVGDGDLPEGVGAAAPAPLVVADELVALGECRFGHERDEPVGEDRADEQERLPGSADLVFELDAVHRDGVHDVLP
ncbi:hypothetical protein [Streptomyces sp. NBC_01006]|uniref:hypothetical protein n=1 Tax=Streptomyces sp. NBC_01006 TaxID=2903716 RepID=UPI00386B7E4E|nr:hypothetical protein OG509_06510 [Streptomyces sp. NBC_01006]